MSLAILALALWGVGPAWAFEYGTTPTGQGGLIRALDARRTEARVWIHSVNLGYFQQRSFLEDYFKDKEISGAYSLTFSPSRPVLLDRAEWSLSWEGRYHTTRIEQPDRRVQNLVNSSAGDPTLGAKFPLREGDLWSLAAAFRGRVLSSPGTWGMSLDTFSPDFLLLNSLSFGRFQLHVNAGYRLDNTFDVFEKNEDNAVPLRSTRFSQGVVTGDSYIVSAGAEASVIPRVAPFIEGAAFYDADGKALDSRGRAVNVAFSNNPIWITPGVKARLAHRIVGELAMDLGMLSKRFPGEDEVLPVWKVLVGVSFLDFPRESPVPEAAVLPQPPPGPPSERAIEETPAVLPPAVPSQGTLEGFVVDPTGAPLGAVLRVNRKWTTESNPTDGAFHITVEPGPHLITAESEGFERFAQDFDIVPDHATVLKIVLTPLARVRVTGEKIVIYDKVFFEKNQANILPASFPVLNEVAGVLRNSPGLRVRVEGHTDSGGAPERNLQFSQTRAEAVVKYLVSKGIESSRLEAKGFGDTVPIADNATEEGKSLNRRVEFVVLEGLP